MKGKNRLLEVVMISSYYQRMAVRRAPRLRFFSEKGYSLGSPSAKPERKRRREERLHYQKSSHQALGYEILALDFAAPELCIRIVLVYRPPSTPLHITEQLAEAISDLAVASCPVIVIGDFNIPEIDWAQWNPSRENSHPLAETFAYHGFSQFHLINNISINSALGHSDHSSISFEITASLPPCVPVFKRLFHKCDYSRVLSYLSSILWVESFETLSTLDDKYSMFLSILIRPLGSRLSE
ncbi:hypothetical protein COOONC_05848 [Cooperia oncophora]